MHDHKLRPLPVPRVTLTSSVDGPARDARAMVEPNSHLRGSRTLVVTNDSIDALVDGVTLAHFSLVGFEVLHPRMRTPLIRRVAPTDLSDWSDFRFATRTYLGFDLPPAPPPPWSDPCPGSLTHCGGTGVAVTPRV